jgi:hypothetical protein
LKQQLCRTTKYDRLIYLIDKISNYLKTQTIHQKIKFDNILFEIIEISQMLKTTKKLKKSTINLSYTQFERSTSNIADQSFPRRLVGQPRRAYSCTEVAFDFFSRT